MPAHAAPVPPAFAQRLEARLRSGGFADKDALQRWKQATARELGVALPSDPDLALAIPADLAQAWAPLLRKKPARSLSGVAVVAVMSSPAACPHGKCVFCPGGPEVGVPQSYTGFEPSTMRAMRLGYDPYRIVRTRLAALEHNGHAVDKVELVVQGGTFPARDPAYQDWFMAMLHAACTDGPAEAPPPAEPEAAWQAMGEAERARRLAAAQAANEGARCRVVGLTVETKPDWCLEPHLDRMLRHGVTRIEVGLQCLDDDVLRLTHRGHTLEDSRQALRAAREAGFKVCVHLMPGLPRRRTSGADGRGRYETDAAADADDLRRLFEEEDWRPDMLKVYPTLVVREGETPLKKWWQEGRYTPLGTAEAAAVVAEGLRHVPPWCRIQRVDRDIPTTHVEAGVQHSNLRQVAEAEARRQGIAVREVRAREAGQRAQAGVAVDPSRAVPVRRDYAASGGAEAFLALEDPPADALFGFCRLRRLAAPHRPELRHPAGAAVVRELKVFGTALAVGAAGGGEGFQHQGHGARLLAWAEEVAFGEWEAGRLAVLAGVGVKGYYRRRGYVDLGPYLAKDGPQGCA